ncbi:hypothetical protein ACIBJC_00110 [Streptomyces sp. NPDC050509]|uniref:hypothetical protein n=1 Tax=Streptomyces sp. NPDC050509 TaxID=3365620 RepID=UPI003788A75F
MVPVAARQQVQHGPPVTGAALLPAVRGEQSYGAVPGQGRGPDGQIDEPLPRGPFLDHPRAVGAFRPDGGARGRGGGDGHGGGTECARGDQGGKGAA